MKSALRMLVLCSLALFAASCSNDHQKQEYVVNLSENDFPFIGPDAVKIASAMKLESPGDTPVSFFMRAISSPDHYYLIGQSSPGQQVYKYDAAGSFAGLIGGIGKGPGEYVSARDIGADFENDRFFVLNEGRQLIEYTTVGSYQQAFEMKTSSSFALNPEGQFFQYKALEEGNSIILSDPSGNLVQKHLLKKTAWEPAMENNFHKSPQGLFFREAFSNTVYQLDEQGVRPFVTFHWEGKSYLPEYDQLDLMGIFQAMTVEGKFLVFNTTLVGEEKVYACFTDQKEGVMNHVVYHLSENKVSGFRSRPDQGIFFALLMNEEQQPGFIVEGVILNELFPGGQSYDEHAKYLVFLEIG